MSLQSAEIKIPNIKLNRDELLTVIRQLDAPTRIQVAQVLAETEMDAKLEKLIQQLAETPPFDAISDADIDAEVNAVRQQNK